ncbi:unnamed protein product [Pleuronectes platessa]|uniref:Uncharacterized protein n=1 Tax=Pleuronectes platessa TaxID=8262 RepID=A0A9N7U0H7_PLEPL|nr:unnamed protein product [Pleuronectes platessa]
MLGGGGRFSRFLSQTRTPARDPRFLRRLSVQADVSSGGGQLLLRAGSSRSQRSRVQVVICFYSFHHLNRINLSPFHLRHQMPLDGVLGGEWITQGPCRLFQALGKRRQKLFGGSFCSGQPFTLIAGHGGLGERFSLSHIAVEKDTTMSSSNSAWLASNSEEALRSLHGFVPVTPEAESTALRQGCLAVLQPPV